MFFPVLSCYLLFCDVLLCSVLFCYVMLCYVMLCSALLCSVMFCSVLFCSVLFCSVLLGSIFYSILYLFLFAFCSVPCRPELFCSVPSPLSVLLFTVPSHLVFAYIPVQVIHRKYQVDLQEKPIITSACLTFPRIRRKIRRKLIN